MSDSGATDRRDDFVALRALVQRGRDRERRRILRLVDELQWVASISPNGEVTENALSGLKEAIDE